MQCRAGQVRSLLPESSHSGRGRTDNEWVTLQAGRCALRNMEREVSEGWRRGKGGLVLRSGDQRWRFQRGHS